MEGDSSKRGREGDSGAGQKPAILSYLLTSHASRDPTLKAGRLASHRIFPKKIKNVKTKTSLQKCQFCLFFYCQLMQ